MSRLPRWIGLLSVVSLIVGAQASTAIARKPPPAQPGEEAAVEAIRKFGSGEARNDGRISSVSFGRTAVDDRATEAFHGLTKLDSIDFILAKITDATPANIAGCTSLTHVEFCATPITDVGVAHLAALKNLQFLGLAGTRITDAGLSCLGSLPELRRINLEQTAITDRGLSHLARFPNLKELSLSRPRKELERDGKRFFVVKAEPAGSQGQGYIEVQVDAKSEASFAGPIITDDGLPHLASLDNLTGLDLSGTDVTAVGLKHLSRLTQLHTLMLTGTKVSDVGLEHLAALENLSGLELDETDVTDAGLVHVAKLSKLVRLMLSGTKITDAGLRSLLPLSKLAYLNLDDTDITDAGLVELAKIETLKTISLKRTRVTSAGLAHLHGRKELTVYVHGTQVGAKGAAEWLAAAGSRYGLHYDVDRTKFDAYDRPIVAEDPAAEAERKENAAALESLAKGDVAWFVAALDRRPELIDAHLHSFPIAFGTRERGPNRPCEAIHLATPLHIAVYHDDLATARLLLERGASARARDFHGRTPPAFAASTEMIDLLVEYDTVIESKAAKRPALFDARNGEVALALIRRGADVRRLSDRRESALHEAIEAGRTDVARVLVEHGAVLNHQDLREMTPLHVAASLGEVDLVRFLLARGADVHRFADGGKTALHCAAMKGHLDVIELLLAHGVDVNTCRPSPSDDKSEVMKAWGEVVATIPLTLPMVILTDFSQPELWDGMAELGEETITALEQADSSRDVPPLVTAVTAGKMEAARYLVSRGARYDFGNCGRGADVFEDAVQSASPGVVRYMLDHGAAVHCKRRSGAALLITAIRNRQDIEVIRMLLDSGAPLNGTLPEDELPADNDPLSTGDGLVLGWGGIEVDVIQADTRGWTPLHFATRLGYEDAAHLLMERGADVHARSTVGETPLDLAVPFEQPRPGVDDEFPDEYETGRVVRNKARTAIGELLKTVQAKTPAATLRR